MTESSTRRLALARRTVFFVALTLLLAGCEHSPQGFWLRPQSDFARILQDLFSTIVFMAGIVFFVVEAILFLAVFKYRQRNNQIPSQTHGNTNIEIAWTIAPALVLAVVAVPTVRTIFESYHPQREGTVQVKVIGHQWWWEYQYPEFGITTANEIHFPVGQKATLTIESADVIHGYWIPNLGGKRDAIPTRTNELWWTPEKAGVYYGQCTQLCGTSHANMRLRAIVHEKADWDKWVASMKAANGQPPANADPKVARGYQVISTAQCIACHTIQGTPLQGKVGPNLTKFGERTTFGAGMYDMDHDALVHWIADPQGAKPGNKMPKVDLSDEDRDAVATYLMSLK